MQVIVGNLDDLILGMSRVNAISGLMSGQQPASQAESDAKFEEVSARLTHLTEAFINHASSDKIRDAVGGSIDDIGNFGSMALSLFLAGDTGGCISVIQAMFAFAYMMGLDGRTDTYPEAPAAPTTE